MHLFLILTADDSQPKTHNKSSRSFSLTVSSREIPSYRNENKREGIKSKNTKTSGETPRKVKGAKVLDKTPHCSSLPGTIISNLAFRYR